MANIRDVARESGVSASTVSQVLNEGGRPVNAETRARVLQAARRLRYHPNAMARGLLRKRMDTLGMVFLHSHQPIHTAQSFLLMMDGILNVATRHRQNTLFCTGYSWSDGDRNLSTLLDRRCDGLILMVPTRDTRLVPILREQGVPFVVLCGQSDDPGVTTVDVDNAGEVRALVGRMAADGHRRIALVHGGPEQQAFSYCGERVRGWREALGAAGLPGDDSLIAAAGGSDESLARLMGRPSSERPTAFFCVTDLDALAVAGRLGRAGWRIPEDVSVVGFDDIPDAARSRPPLATVHQPLREIGERCAEMLLAQIAGEEEPGRKVLLPAEVCWRGSYAPRRPA